jgi:hypothetical protein
LKSTSTALSSKKPAQTTAKEEAAVRQKTQAANGGVKTVLVASYGWPTEEMQPSRRQAARR